MSVARDPWLSDLLGKPAYHVAGRTDKCTVGDLPTGEAFVGAKVPVENERGAQGTQDSHWRESVLGSELMTGFVDSGQNPLSVVTVESLADLGYLVNSEPADSYTVPLGTASLIQSAAAAGTRLYLKDDVWRGPLYRVDRSGRLTAILRR